MSDIREFMKLVESDETTTRVVDGLAQRMINGELGFDRITLIIEKAMEAASKAGYTREETEAAVESYLHFLLGHLDSLGK